MIKNYIYSSVYKLPYERLSTFESRIEYPESSENLALKHVRSNKPKGFWNHGILGEILHQRNPETPDLPSTPLSISQKTIYLESEFHEVCDNLYVSVSFFEGLDSSEAFFRIIDETMMKLKLKKLHLCFEFIPVVGRSEMDISPGIDELLVALTERYQVLVIPAVKLKQKLFSKRDHFLHVHNKIFYYYSSFEVKAKMHGASILYLHPQEKLLLDENDTKALSFLDKDSLNLTQLQYLGRFFKKLNFGVGEC